MAVWRIIQAPIIIVADDDRIRVVAIVAANVIARYIVAIVDIPEGRPRIIAEWPVPTIIEGPW